MRECLSYDSTVQCKFHLMSQVIMESYGISQPLFVVKGSCHGIEITLDSEHVPFGAVVLHSLSKRRVLMVNSGDIGAR